MTMYSPAFPATQAYRPLAEDQMLMRLLSVLRYPPQGTEYGLVERNACRLALGITGFELDAVIRRGRQRGLVDTQSAYDRVALTPRGLQKLLSA
ncbi:MAG: hypothetical protein OJI70_04520 [Zavarzinia sp.]|nr:hypothetical protein [Zavarzinia sp.]